MVYSNLYQATLPENNLNYEIIKYFALFQQLYIPQIVGRIIHQ